MRWKMVFISQDNKEDVPYWTLFHERAERGEEAAERADGLPKTLLLLPFPPKLLGAYANE